MWIKHIPYDDASGELRALYDRASGPDRDPDPIMLAHSLRPHTMEGHMALYKAVLRHPSAEVPKWLLETIGVWVSLLNECAWGVEHHFAGLKRLLEDDARAGAIRKALEARTPDTAPLTRAEIAALHYADALTAAPNFVDRDEVEELREAGWDDGAILEINQVVAYLAYANRTVLGLGVTADGGMSGL
ncbi:MAG TPA: alkylhydroperoxidase [Paracoccaceae bacterium]|nr:alkylhydroperoxidase [Paracoccaceae bacterium]